MEVVPGVSGDPVDRLVRLAPGLAEGLEGWRREAEAEAAAAADAARAAPAPDAPRDRPFVAPFHSRPALEATS